MSTAFKRPVGAQADVKELEYIAALHQTCMPNCRENGTVSSLDVCRFLKSRMRLNVSHSQGIHLVRDLGGGQVGQDVIDKIKGEAQKQPENTQKKRFKLIRLKKKSKKHDKTKKKDAQDSVKDPAKNESSKKDSSNQDPATEEAQDLAEEEGWDDMEVVVPTFSTAGSSSDESAVFTPSDKDVEQGASNESPEYSPESPQDDDDVQDENKLEEYLDIVQLTAVLLIPTLARAGQEWRDVRTPKAPEQEPAEPPTYHGIQGKYQELKDKRAARIQKFFADLHESLRPKPETILPDVLSIMLKYVATSSEESYPAVTPDLIRKLLLVSGEYERAADSVMIEKMVEAASSSSGLFDEEAFVNALTSDLKDWKVGCEDNETTGWYDVWGYESYREKREVEAAQKAEQEEQEHFDKKDAVEKQHGEKGGPNDSDDAEQVASDSKDIEEAKMENPASLSWDAGVVPESNLSASPPANSVDEKDKYQMNRTFKLANVDYAADAFSSTMLTVTIFLFFVCTALVYATLIQGMDKLQPSCQESFWCELARTIITWFTFAAILIACGYVVMVPLSIGNNPAQRSPTKTLIALALSLFYNWLPYAAVNTYRQRIEEPHDTSTEKTVEDDRFGYGQWITHAVGILLSCTLALQFILALIGNHRIRASRFLSKWFATSTVCGCWHSKQAATRKINAILENAHKLHPKREFNGRDGRVSSDQAMLNYLLNGEQFEDCGGFFWTWKKLLLGKLFDHEGVWIMSRLTIIQAIQILFYMFYSYLIYQFIQRVVREAEGAQNDLASLAQDVDYDLPQWMYNITPSPDHVRQALYPAYTVMLVIMLVLMALYLPSYVGTTLKYRSGIKGSLGSPDFPLYRKQVDYAYMNIGNAIYAMLGSGFLFFFLVALVIFLCLWPYTQHIMILIIAWGLGLGITICIKIVISTWFRRRFYSAYYRFHPQKADLSTVALECWYIGLGGGVLVTRFAQFLLAACFFVGRTDVPFLSSDVVLFGYAFDYVPTNFVRDLLVHEAHRHPYLDRLLTMYMMKLKNPKFCSDAGACWRQLFVMALMPWLVKYRVFTDARLADATDDYNARRRANESALIGNTDIDAVEDAAKTKVGTVTSGVKAGVAAGVAVGLSTVESGAAAGVDAVETGVAAGVDTVEEEVELWA